MDISAVVLNKLIQEQSLEVWAKLKLVFLDPAYSSLYTCIGRHYETYAKIPSFADLELTIREENVGNLVASVKLADVPEVTIDVALDALIDQYTQNITLNLLDKFVDKLPLFDTEEIKSNLAAISLEVEEKTFTSENVFSMADIMVFQREEDIAKERVYLGINNTFDSVLGGVARQELIMIGGRRGSGKSIVGSNLFVNQYESGNTSIYFSIEMIAQEVLQRNMAIHTGVNLQNLKRGKLTDEEVLIMLQARANMFEGSEGLVQDFLRHRDKFAFEETLVRECRLKDNQMIIVDDRDLTLSSIDLHVGKAKSKYGDKLKLAVVDYLNQIVVEGKDMYDWKTQIEVSKRLKNLARKHDIVIASPYQIDATGEARFSKGILDAADIAMTLDAHDKEDAAISFDTTKIRGAKEMKFTSGINWDTLRISPVGVDAPVKKATKKESNKKNDSDSSEPAWDL